MKLYNYRSWFVSSLRYAGILSITLFSAVLHSSNGVNVSLSNGTAIHGFDPVAYFVDGEPRRGNEKYRYQHEGVTWQFSSEQNMRVFIGSPQNYMPQYGGHCAYAASKNAIANVNPSAWTIHNGKLYLNYSLNVRQAWKSDINSNIDKADGFWPELVKQVE